MAFSERGLRAFVTVAEELHFGRAAKRLRTSQPPLSRDIKRLEEDVGARLFERHEGWGIELSEAGAFFLERARELLAEAERARDDVRRIARGEVGVLSIAYTPTATYEVLPLLLRAHRKRRPDVEIVLYEMRSDRVAEAVDAKRVDVGFACGPMGLPGLAERVLDRERFVAALPRSHPLAAKRALRVRELDGEAMIVVNPTIEPIWASACTEALARAGISMAVTQLVDTKVAMLGLVAAGMGVSLVTRSMTCLGRDGVVFREISDLKAEVPLVALLPQRPSPRAVELLDLARSRG